MHETSKPSNTKHVSEDKKSSKHRLFKNLDIEDIGTTSKIGNLLSTLKEGKNKTRIASNYRYDMKSKYRAKEEMQMSHLSKALQP